MAPSTVSAILGAPADGATFSGQAHRLGMVSRATIMGLPTDSMRAQSGIIPAFGEPLNVRPSSPASMDVTVVAGVAAIQGAADAEGVHSVVVPSNVGVGLAASHATLARIDLVILEVYADGTSASAASVKVVTGTPAPSPTRPSLVSPPPYTSWFPLAQVRVEASATQITADKITKLANVDGVFTCAPGGTRRGAKRFWSGSRTTLDQVASGVTGNIVSCTVPAAECLPGVYVASYTGNFKNQNPGGSSIVQVFIRRPPGAQRAHLLSLAQDQAMSFSGSSTWVFDTQPTADQVWQLAMIPTAGGPVEFGYAGAPSVVEVVRVSDL